MTEENHITSGDLYGTWRWRLNEGVAWPEQRTQRDASRYRNNEDNKDDEITRLRARVGELEREQSECLRLTETAREILGNAQRAEGERDAALARAEKAERELAAMTDNWRTMTQECQKAQALYEKAEEASRYKEAIIGERERLIRALQVDLEKAERLREQTAHESIKTTGLMLEMRRERDAAQARVRELEARAERLGAFFKHMRSDPFHHLGLGDIRLSIGEQEEIVCALAKGEK